jgi:hypothetical protein
MFYHQELVWQQAYNLQWGNGTCVAGSTGQPSSQTGFDTSYFDSAPPDSAKNFAGADITWSYPGALKVGEKGAAPSQSASVSASASSSTATSTAAPVPTSNGAASLGGASVVVGGVAMLAGLLVI